MRSPNASANLTREETSARAAAITLREMHVHVDLREARDTARSGFPVTARLEFDARAAETWIDFLGEEVSSVTVNGENAAVDWDGARIRLRGLSDGANVVTVVATGAYSNSGEGLHRFVDPVDGETYLYTQYEPADARRVVPCFEQPDMKASWRFTVDAPAGWTVLSNQPEAEARVEGDVQTVAFAPTPPLSSYITAIAAGPYHVVTDEWRDGDLVVPLGVACRASLAPHLDAAEILEVTKQGLAWFGEAFAYPYPWGKYDQLFAPEYNLGAMENPGLVTFTEDYIFRGASTDAQHQARADTILHEMAHMWFGDLATMRWWDDLWLKESFADFMGSHVSVAATRFSEAWANFASRRKAWAYQADQLPTTHPIVADIPDLEAAKLNFDGITYAKGASVLKQLVAFVGEEAFFDAARRYFAAHAFGNTTLDDLLRALTEASGRDVRAWADAWLLTTGVSTITLERDGDDVALVQTDPRPHRLALGLYALEDDRLVRRGAIDLDIAQERTVIAEPAAGAVRAADLVLVNERDLTYAKARLDARSLAAVERAQATLPDTLSRGLVWSALWNAVRDGDLPTARYLEVVRRHAVDPANTGLLAGLLANAQYAVEHYVPRAELPEARRAWLEATWSALQEADAASDGQLAWARAFAAAAAYDDARAGDIRAMLDGRGPAGLPLDPQLRWSLVTALVATGHAGEADVDAELARDDTAAGRTAAITARAARPDADVRAAAWRSAWSDLSLSNEHLDATIAGFRAGGRRDLAAPFDADYFARIREAWGARSIEIARRLVRGLFPETEDLEAVDAWLEANQDAPGALRRIVLEQRDHLARDLRVRAAATR